MCHHPVWGGWFALRGVAIFPGVETPLARPQVDQSLTLSPDQAVEMITLYNECWQVFNETVVNFSILLCVFALIAQLFFFCFFLLAFRYLKV